MCRCVDMIQLKIDNEFKYLSTNITTTTRTTQLHEIETNKLTAVSQSGVPLEVRKVQT